MDANDITLRQALKAKTVGAGNWVQTERSAHEAWAKLISEKPRAAMLLHHLVAQMGSLNAVVIGQDVLAKLMGVHIRTVARAVKDLVDGRWIETVRIGKGKECAYIVNSRVAWGQKRENLRLSVFHAVVIADYHEQENIGQDALRKIPTLYPGEQQLPYGAGEPPPSQPYLENLEPDLPARKSHEDLSEFERLEFQGQQRLID